MKNILHIALAAALVIAPLCAQEFSVPAGYVSVDVKPSPNGAAHALTHFSVPLQPPAVIPGKPSGRITAVGANTLSNSTAGWTAGALSTAASPYYVKIRTGAAAGRLFRITANTANQLTLDTQGLTLTSLGIAAGDNGDRYQIFPALTLLSLLGTPAEGVVGGTSAEFAAGQTDRVIMNDPSGVARTYYYDEDASEWRRASSGASQDTLVISPSAGLTYYRISTSPLNLLFTGNVPSEGIVTSIPVSGTTLLGSYFPATISLGTLGIDTLPGWRKLGDPGVTLDTADRILAEDAAGITRSYYFDGTSWKRPGSSVSQNTTSIPAGSAIHATRFGTGAADAWNRTLPYTLP